MSNHGKAVLVEKCENAATPENCTEVGCAHLSEDTYEYRAVLFDILETNLSRAFSARSYLTVKGEMLGYTDFSFADNSRSVYEVAKATLADPDSGIAAGSEAYNNLYALQQDFTVTYKTGVYGLAEDKTITLKRGEKLSWYASEIPALPDGIDGQLYFDDWQANVDGFTADAPVSQNVEFTAKEYALSFTDNGDGTLTVAGAGDLLDKTTEIVIPQTWNGKTVTDIAVAAFQYHTKLTGVTFPEGINVGMVAFEGAGIRTLNFPKMGAIGHAAFQDCDELTAIYFPEGNANACTYDGTRQFASCDKLETVRYTHMDTMTDLMFLGCNALKTFITGDRIVTFRDALSSVEWENTGKNVLGDCSVYYNPNIDTGDAQMHLRIQEHVGVYDSNNLLNGKIYVYSETETVGGWRYVDGVATPYNTGHYYTGAVQGATVATLTKPVCDYVNDVCSICGAVRKTLNYSFADGAYTVTGLADASVTDLTIPETYDDGTNGVAPVTKIATQAFVGNTTLKSVSMKSVMTIESQAFMGCTALTTVSIIAPDFVTWSGDMQFYNCKSLRTVICGNRFTLPTRVFFANCNDGAYPEAYQAMHIYVSTAYQADSQAINWDCTDNVDKNGGNNLMSGKVYFYSETSVAGAWRYVDGVATAWNADSYYTKATTSWEFTAPTV